MKKYYPSYYEEFSCLADKCSDTCCAKWEIVIDDETLRKYNSLNDEFSDKIKKCLIRNEDDEVCFSLINGRCPFLKTNGLCDIHINLGEEYTSRICRDHPRFTEEYDGFTEISLSLSCPSVAEIFFGSEDFKDEYPTPFYNGDDEVLDLLISSRKELLAQKTDFFSLNDLLLDKAADDQLDIDLVYVSSHPEIGICFIKDYIKYILDNCTVLTDEWEHFLVNSLEYNTAESSFYDFIRINDESITKVMRYYIYRYYLKAVNDLDIYSRALFIVSSCYISVFVAMANSIPFSESARIYSKEIEHNIENLDLLNSYLSEF